MDESNSVRNINPNNISLVLVQNKSVASYQYEGLWKARDKRNKHQTLIVLGERVNNEVEVEFVDSSRRNMKKTALMTNYLMDTPAVPVMRGLPPAPTPQSEEPVCVLVENEAPMGPERSKLHGLLLAQAQDGATIVTIYWELTPALAAELLLVNFNNRPTSATRARVLARDILAGHWAKTNQGLALSPELFLGDAQHRCMAVVIADRAIPMQFNWYRDQAEYMAARKTWDSGSKRSKGGALEMAGLVAKGHGAEIAAVINAMAYVDQRITPKATNDEIADCYLERKAHIDVAMTLPKREFGAPARAAFAIAHEKAPTETSEAIRCVVEKVGFSEGSPLHTLVKRLGDIQRSPDKTAIIQDLLSLLYRHATGKPGLKQLRASQDAYHYFLGGNYRPLASK